MVWLPTSRYKEGFILTDKAFIGRIWSIIRDVGTQSALAEKIGTSQGTIADWVNRGSFPSTKHLANLKEKLNININWLITGIGPRYLTATDRVKEEEAGYIPHGHTREEQDYTEKLVKIMRTKMDGTVQAIKQNIDAFLTTPDKEEEVKKIAKAG